MPESSVVFVPAPVLHGKLARLTFLNANHRPHWSQRAKVTKAWREAAHAAVRHTEGVPFYQGRVHITATVHKARGGRYDVGNLSPTVKACIDGTVDAGVLPDDSNAYLVGPDLRAGTPRPEAPGVVLTITPLHP